MLAASASLLNIPVVILDVGAEVPALRRRHPISRTSTARSDSRPAKIRELATKVDVLAVEIEHKDVDELEEVEAR